MTAGDPTDNPRRLLDELLAIREVLGEEAAQGVDPSQIPILNDVVAGPPPGEAEPGLENIDEDAIEEAVDGTEALDTDAVADPSAPPTGEYADVLDIDVAIPCFTLGNVLIDEDEPDPPGMTAELPPVPDNAPARRQPQTQTGAMSIDDQSSDDRSGDDQSIADYLAASLVERSQDPPAGFQADSCEAEQPPDALIDELVAEWLPTLENALRERLMRMTAEQLDRLQRR